MTALLHRIERAYPWLLLAPVILPVVVWSGCIYPYLVPKTLLFYALSLVSAGMFAVLVAHGRTFFWPRLAQWEVWIPGALLALAYGTSLVGADFYRSFWSLFVRGDGLLMLTCAVASFYLIILSADRTFFTRLLYAASSVGTFVAVYGIGEWLFARGRIGGLLGNAAFFAGYLGITFFATLIASRTLSGQWKRFAIAGAVLQVIAITLSATRGTMLALGVAFFVALVHLATRSKGKSRTWSAWLLVALVTTGTLFFTFRSEIAKVPFTPIARIASVSLAEGDVASRLFIWKNMMGEIRKSPWTGVGAEHVDVLFNRFYDPTQIYEQWFDRSHNAFIDYTAQYGIGGLLLYLLLIASFITAAVRYARRADRPTAGLFVLLAVTYAVQNIFVFDTVSSFWLLLAFLAAFTAMSLNEGSCESLSLPSWVRPTSWALALVLAALVVQVSVRPAIAAYDLAHAYTYQLVDVSKEIGYLSRGFALGTYGDVEYGYTAYDMYAHTQASLLTGQARVDAYEVARSILTTDFNRYPYDARTALYLAHVLSLAPMEVKADRELLGSALERAIRLSPKRAQPWYILTNLSISGANTYPPSSKERIAGYTAARDLLSRYITFVPTLSEPYFVLAQLLYASGDKKGASDAAQKGKDTYIGTLESATRAAGYYETVVDLPNAAFFLGEVVRIDPTNTAARSDLEKIQTYERSKK